jgi:hypothetical protein
MVSSELAAEISLEARQKASRDEVLDAAAEAFVELDMAIQAVRPVVDSDQSAADRLFAMASAHARLMVEEASYMRLAVQHAEMALALEGRAPRKALLDVFALRQEYEGYFERVIAEGVDSGEFRPVTPNLVAKAGLGSLNWIGVWFRPNGRGRSATNTNDIADEFARFFLAGLRVPNTRTGSSAR